MTASQIQKQGKALKAAIHAAIDKKFAHDGDRADYEHDSVASLSNTSLSCLEVKAREFGVSI